MPYTLVQKPYPTFGILAFPYLERRTLHYTLMAINASQFLRKSDHVIFFILCYHVHGRLRPMYKDFLHQENAATEPRIHEMVSWLHCNDVWYQFICEPKFICFKIASLRRIKETYASLKIK